MDDLEEVQLFYYFVESERNPVEDPLVLWLTGGPGCSGFSALAYEIGKPCFSFMWDFALTNFLSVQKMRVIYEIKSSPVLIGL